MGIKHILSALVLIAVPGTLATSQPALGATERASLPDIEDEVMCPTCEVPLNQAFSPQAERQRKFIKGLIKRGRTKEQIKQALVDQFGPDILALPDTEKRGINWAAYLIPVLAFGAGAGAVALFLVRRRRSKALATGEMQPIPPLSAEDTDRLEHDLERYDV